MRMLVKILAVTMMLGLLAGCATNFPMGTLYTDVRLPLAATAAGGDSPRMGEAECISIMTLIAFGDASIETAKRNGGITQVHHVDWHVDNLLGIIGKYKVTVYGE